MSLEEKISELIAVVSENTKALKESMAQRSSLAGALNVATPPAPPAPKAEEAEPATKAKPGRPKKEAEPEVVVVAKPREEEAEAEEPGLTKEKLQSSVQAFVNLGGDDREARSARIAHVKEVLASYGAKLAGEIPEKKWPEFLAKVQDYDNSEDLV